MWAEDNSIRQNNIDFSKNLRTNIKVSRIANEHFLTKYLAAVALADARKLRE